MFKASYILILVGITVRNLSILFNSEMQQMDDVINVSNVNDNIWTLSHESFNVHDLLSLCTPSRVF